MNLQRRFLEEKVQNIQRKVSSIEEKVQEMYDYLIDPDEVEKKLTDLEDRFRGNNLQIDGEIVRPRTRFLWRN